MGICSVTVVVPSSLKIRVLCSRSCEASNLYKYTPRCKLQTLTDNTLRDNINTGFHARLKCPLETPHEKWDWRHRHTSLTTHIHMYVQNSTSAEMCYFGIRSSCVERSGSGQHTTIVLGRSCISLTKLGLQIELRVVLTQPLQLSWFPIRHKGSSLAS